MEATEIDTSIKLKPEKVRLFIALLPPGAREFFFSQFCAAPFLPISGPLLLTNFKINFFSLVPYRKNIRMVI